MKDLEYRWNVARDAIITNMKSIIEAEVAKQVQSLIIPAKAEPQSETTSKSPAVPSIRTVPDEMYEWDKYPDAVCAALGVLGNILYFNNMVKRSPYKGRGTPLWMRCEDKLTVTYSGYSTGGASGLRDVTHEEITASFRLRPDTTKQAPCPHCGDIDTCWMGSDGSIVVKCRTCGACGPTARNKEDAMKQWNRRV